MKTEGTEEKRIQYWRISPGSGGYLWREQKLNHCIAIGWSDIGDAKDLDRDGLYRLYKKTWNDGTKKEADYAADQLDDFINKVSIRDKVVASTSGKGIYAVGTITGEYQFNDELEYKHSREVLWETTFWHPIEIEELGLKSNKKLFDKFHGQSSKTIRDLSETEWNTFSERLNKIDTPFRNLGMWGGMVQAPEYENEVMILFSHMLQHFNMRIIQFGTRFPDAIVERKNGKKWEKLSVEFELRSSGFQCHLPDCEERPCDLIVCWKHDWNPPKKWNFEIIELKKQLEKIL
jgi:hypothetical protein